VILTPDDVGAERDCRKDTGGKYSFLRLITFERYTS
jgi:hypothetical protein